MNVLLILLIFLKLQRILCLGDLYFIWSKSKMSLLYSMISFIFNILKSIFFIMKRRSTLYSRQGNYSQGNEEWRRRLVTTFLLMSLGNIKAWLKWWCIHPKTSYVRNDIRYFKKCERWPLKALTFRYNWRISRSKFRMGGIEVSKERKSVDK